MAFVTTSVALHLGAYTAFGDIEPPPFEGPPPPSELSFTVLEPQVEQVTEEEPPVVEEAPEPEPEPVRTWQPPPEPEVEPEPETAPEPIEPEPIPLQEEPEPLEPEEAAASGAATDEPAAGEAIVSTEGGMAVDARGGGTGRGVIGPGAGGRGGRVAPPPPPPPPSPAVDRRALLESWRDRVQRLLAEQAGRNYPRAARRAGLQGVVFLSIVVDARGRVSGVSVYRESQHDSLNDAAVAAVRGIDSLPAPPPALRWTARPLRMPIVYRLQ